MAGSLGRWLGTVSDQSPGLAKMGQVAGNEPTPEFAVQVGEQCAQLLDCLDDDVLRQVAIAKLEGYTNNEIAEQQGTSRRTVERQLGLIRRIWTQERKS